MRLITTTLVVSITLLSIGCASAPCVPTHEIVEVMVPVSSCPAPPDIPPFAIPDWPVLPTDATTEEIKTWYVDMVETMIAREAIIEEENTSLRDIIKSYGDVPQ